MYCNAVKPEKNPLAIVVKVDELMPLLSIVMHERQASHARGGHTGLLQLTDRSPILTRS